MGDVSSSSGEESENHRQFPVGLRVLVIDDDPICLKIIDKMLRSCNYEVTTCAMATLALSMLRERSGSFDLVITDVYMPDMNGYELLEHIGLEMDLPVIMISADVEVKAAMKGLKHGACFYLMKPVRMEELKNIWQHAVRKKKNDYKEHRRQVSGEDSEILRKAKDSNEHASSENVENSERHKRRKGVKEEDEENDDSSALKKQRVVWLPELHQQFLAAVEKLGTDKAVPKKILELMNVPGLTRENVASHLQKFRGFLRKLSEAREPQGAFAPNFQGCAINKNFESNVHEMLDFKHLVGSSHLSQPSNVMPLQSGLSDKTHNLNANVDMLDLSSLHLFNQEPQSNNYLARLRNCQGQPLLNSRRNFFGGGNCTTGGSNSSSESKQFPFMQGSNRNLRFYLSSLRDTATSQMGGLDLDKGLTSNALRAIHQQHQQRSDHISTPQFDTLGIAQMYPTGSQFSNFSSTGNGCSYGRFGHIPSLDSLNGYVTDLPGNSNLFSGLSQERLTFNAPRDVEQVSCMFDEISKSGKENQQFHNVVLGLEEKALSNSGHACNEMVSSCGFQYSNQYNGTSGCGIPQKNDNCSNAKVGGLSDVLLSLESENNLLPRQVMQDDLHELISPQHDDGVDLTVSDIDIDAYQLDDIHTFSDQV